MTEVVVILHGWGSKVEKWKPVVEELEKAGLEVFLPALPGFGQTPPPEKPWGVADYTRWVKKRLPKKYFLLGHSFGGRVAIKLASQKPAGLEGLILVNSAGVSRPFWLKRLFFLCLAKVGKLFFSPGWRKILYQWIGEKDYYQAKGVMRETLKKVIGEDLKKDLPKIKVPTLILWGKEDQATPLSDGKLLHRLIPRSSLRIFSGVGHRLPYQQPKKTAQAIIEFKEQV